VTVDCKGKLLKGGKPLEVAQRELGLGQVAIEFIPLPAPDAAGAPASTERFGTTVDAQGNFSRPGGIPPGQYKVAVRQWDPLPNVDKLNGAFAEDKTPLLRTIDGKSEIVIDLDQPGM